MRLGFKRKCTSEIIAFQLSFALLFIPFLLGFQPALHLTLFSRVKQVFVQVALPKLSFQIYFLGTFMGYIVRALA